MKLHKSWDEMMKYAEENHDDGTMITSRDMSGLGKKKDTAFLVLSVSIGIFFIALGYAIATIF